MVALAADYNSINCDSEERDRGSRRITLRQVTAIEIYTVVTPRSDPVRPLTLLCL